MDADPNILQWLYVTFIAPVFGWLGGWFHTWRGTKRRKKTLIKFLSGLPTESKVVLIKFNFEGVHTVRGNPSAPAIALLVRSGVLHVGPGGGTYDAVDSYISVVSEFWEVLDGWIKTDPGIFPLLEQHLEQVENERSLPGI